MKITQLALVLSWFVTCSVSAERYEVVLDQYDNGEYESAYKNFYELAKLGNKDAQYAISTMYLNGKYLDKDRVVGFAWLSLASTKEDEMYVATREKIRGKLSAEELERGLVIFEELKNEFGDKLIDSKLYPEYLGANDQTYTPRRPLRVVTPNYPMDAASWGMWGSVTIEYMVGKDGRTRFHRIISYTEKAFVKAALAAAKKTLYKPAMREGRAANSYSVRRRYYFGMKDTSYNNRVLFDLVGLKKKAEDGSSVDRFEYARTLGAAKNFLNENNRRQFNDGALWNLRAAIDGHPLAKYEVGIDALTGQQCKTDPNKSYYWLHASASEGVSDSQMLLGLELFHGEFFKQDKEEGVAWILRAAEAGNDIARLRYAELASLYPGEGSTNIFLARKLVDKIRPKKFFDKLSYYEINAALYSVQGEFRQAIDAQKRALKQAWKYDIDRTFLKQNMKRYRAKEHIENLVDPEYIKLTGS